MKIVLLVTVAVLCFASPASAGWQEHWTYGYRLAPQAWVCNAYEFARKCNVELNSRTHRCACLFR